MQKLRPLLPTLLAIALSLTLVYVLPLPLDLTGKGIVVLATFAVVFGIDNRLRRRSR
ncbi:MAG: hypothetical protein OHK0039_04360 [Bacteroidia bacterium]